MKCQHFCCSDSECDTGTCLLGIFLDGDAAAGVCADEFMDSGTGGEAGAGGMSGESGSGGTAGDSAAAGEPSMGGAGAGG